MARQIAYKVRVAELLTGSFIKREGWEPSGVVLSDGLEVNRVNLIATAVSETEQQANHIQLLLDDGTGRIAARAFDDASGLGSVTIGSTLLLIAKVREYQGERYLVPEIVRRIENPAWIRFRQLELTARQIAAPQEKAAQQQEMPDALKIVQQLDTGDGADYEAVVAAMKVTDAEKQITTLLESGDLYEIRAGKLKVLE